jgi:hypothetical protein
MGAPDSLVHHRTCTVPCLVHYHVTQPLGSELVDRWRLCPLATPDSLVPL